MQRWSASRMSDEIKIEKERERLERREKALMKTSEKEREREER
jgi:hypothetical protein